MTNLNDQLDFALDQINHTNRAIIMAFVKGIIIPAMVQEKIKEIPKGKSEQVTLDIPKKKETIKVVSDKRSSLVPEGNLNRRRVRKVKDLDDWEKDLIRAKFIGVNGEIHENFCLEIKSELDKDTTIFQVTGFISILHRYVKKGKLEFSDMESYNNFQKQKKLGNRSRKKQIKTKVLSIVRSK